MANLNSPGLEDLHNTVLLDQSWSHPPYAASCRTLLAPFESSCRKSPSDSICSTDMTFSWSPNASCWEIHWCTHKCVFCLLVLCRYRRKPVLHLPLALAATSVPSTATIRIQPLPWWNLLSDRMQVIETTTYIYQPWNHRLGGKRLPTVINRGFCVNVAKQSLAFGRKVVIGERSR